MVVIFLASANTCVIFKCAEGQEQLLDLLGSYFRNAAKYHPSPEDAGNTTYFSKVGASFILASAHALHKLQPTSPLFSQHENIVQSLATNLQNLHHDFAAHPSPDYLFFASLLYALWLLRFDGPDAEKDTSQNLIRAILQYHARVSQPRRDIEEGFYNTLGFSFEQDWPDFVQLAKELGVMLPASAIQLATDPLPLGGAEPHHPAGDTILDVRVNTW